MQIICTGRTFAIEGRMRHIDYYRKCGCVAHDCVVELHEYMDEDGFSRVRITHGTDTITMLNVPGIDREYTMWASRLHGITPARDGHPVPSMRPQ